MSDWELTPASARPVSSAHYHLLSGVLLSLGLYGPWNSAQHLPSTQLKSSPGWLTFWTIFILVRLPPSTMSTVGPPHALTPSRWPAALFRPHQWAQASNFYTHLTLRSLRPEGTKKRSIPTGYGFDTVFCANYMFESLVWIGTTLMTGSVSCASRPPKTGDASRPRVDPIVPSSPRARRDLYRRLGRPDDPLGDQEEGRLQEGIRRDQGLPQGPQGHLPGPHLVGQEEGEGGQGGRAERPWSEGGAEGRECQLLPSGDER